MAIIIVGFVLARKGSSMSVQVDKSSWLGERGVSPSTYLVEAPVPSSHNSWLLCSVWQQTRACSTCARKSPLLSSMELDGRAAGAELVNPSYSMYKSFEILELDDNARDIFLALMTGFLHLP